MYNEGMRKHIENQDGKTLATFDSLYGRSATEQAEAWLKENAYSLNPEWVLGQPLQLQRSRLRCEINLLMSKPKRCPKSGNQSTRFPGIDQCEYCGRMVRTKRDGTYSEHNEPVYADQDEWNGEDS